MRTLTVIACLVFLIPPASPLRAQPSELAPGVRARVTAYYQGVRNRQAGEVLRSTPDSLVLRAEGVQFAWPAAALRRIEVSHGTRRNTLRGAVIGALAMGTTFGLLAYMDEDDCQVWCSGDPLHAFAVYGGIAAVPGAVVGALAGTFIRTERWKRVSLGFSGGGEAIGMRLSLNIGAGPENAREY